MNIDFIPDGSDPLRTLTLLRVRDAEGATEVESQLQVVSRLEAINRLTGGVAHEIKNPLNAIAARVALIESIVEGDAEAEKEVRVVADEIHRLDRVVRTFLDFTQPLEVSREELDIGALAETVVAADRAGRQESWHFAPVQRPTRTWCGPGAIVICFIRRCSTSSSTQSKRRRQEARYGLPLPSAMARAGCVSPTRSGYSRTCKEEDFSALFHDEVGRLRNWIGSRLS